MFDRRLFVIFIIIVIIFVDIKGMCRQVNMYDMIDKFGFLIGFFDSKGKKWEFFD